MTRMLLLSVSSRFLSHQSFHRRNLCLPMCYCVTAASSQKSVWLSSFATPLLAITAMDLPCEFHWRKIVAMGNNLDGGHLDGSLRGIYACIGRLLTYRSWME